MRRISLGLVAMAWSVTGCGSFFPSFDEREAGPPDAKVSPLHDTGIRDTSSTIDTGSAVFDTGSVPDTAAIDTAPPTCQSPLPSDFACRPVATKAGKTVCTDAMIEEFENCFGSGDLARCKAAQTAYPDCSKCVLEDWIVIDEAAGTGVIDVASCIHIVDPTGGCDIAVQCDADCKSVACNECDTTEGSGKTAARSEYDDCVSDVSYVGSATRPKGRCYDVASAQAKICRTEANLSRCFITTLDDVAVFYRGACRDGGDWSKADMPL
jgi:hypothetical protein